MIKELNDENLIIPLWQEAFGDSKEDISFFLNNCKNMKCLGYFDEKMLSSMLFLIDCKISGDEYKYIYAACTYKNKRGRGDMSKLLDYCKSNFNKVCLIPADDKLVDFYFEREFNIKFELNDIQFDESKEIKEYLFEGCSLEKPFVLAHNL